MTTIDEIAQHAGAVELQATYGAAGNPEPWAATVTTYQHGALRVPGSMTGIGQGIGNTFIEAVDQAAHNYSPNSQAEV
jgi:hypothetical protein